MSAVRNVADLGQPMAGPVHASTSSMVMPSCDIRCIADEHRECADAIGDKIGSILGADHAFAQLAIAEIRQSVEHFGKRCGTGNEFDQFHVSRRIEEMRAGPVLLEIGGGVFRDLADGQAGSVGGYDGAGAAMRRYAIEEFALDFEIFGDGFDDPVGFGAAREIVFEIADGDAVSGGWREECGGARFERGFEAGASDAIADAGIGERKAAGFFVGREFAGDDIEQRAGEPGVGDMRGDARAHGSGAEHDDFFDMAFHVQGPQ